MSRFIIGIIAGIYLRSLASYISFYGIIGSIHWFKDMGELVKGLLTLDYYLISRCFTTLFLN